jgi:hypothetical protein
MPAHPSSRRFVLASQRLERLAVNVKKDSVTDRLPSRSMQQTHVWVPWHLVRGGSDETQDYRLSSV